MKLCRVVQVDRLQCADEFAAAAGALVQRDGCADRLWVIRPWRQSTVSRVSSTVSAQMLAPGVVDADGRRGEVSQELDAGEPRR